MVEDDVITDHSNIEVKKYIVIQQEKYKKVVFISKIDQSVQLGNIVILIEGALGHPFGSMFRLVPVEKSRTYKLERVHMVQELTESISTDAASGKDNRHILDTSTSQKLTLDNIAQLRDDGKTGEEIVSHLIENSTTFQEKTQFAQEKYLKKKQKKYLDFVTIFRPTIRHLAEMSYAMYKLEIMNLRIDSLSQILVSTNVHPGGNYLVYENACQGLLVAAVLDRMGGEGNLVQVFQGTVPRQAVNSMNFSRKHLSCLKRLDIKELLKEFSRKPVINKSPEREVTLDNENSTETDNTGNSMATDNTGNSMETDNTGNSMETEDTKNVIKTEDSENALCDDKSNCDQAKCTESKRKVQEKEEEEQPTKKRRLNEYFQRLEEDSIYCKSLLKQRNLDGVIIAVRNCPDKQLPVILDCLALSRPFTLFSHYKEVLTDCYMKLKQQGGFINLRLTETWLREYQVLPNRTHPHISMSGGGGYILTGIKVLAEEDHNSMEDLQKNGADRTRKKLRRHGAHKWRR